MTNNKSLASKYLLYYSLKYEGNWDKIMNAIQTKEEIELGALENTYNAFTGNFITYLDAEYPDRLKQTLKPPFVLFYEGDINLLSNENIMAITHTRYTNKADLKDAETILVNDKPLTYLVADTENDLDKAILDMGKPTIAVLGYSLLLNHNHKADLIITDIPNNVLCKTQDGIMGKYRIMAGIAHKHLVLSATKMSSGMVMVNLMLHLNKEVMVLPKDISDTDLVNNQLLYEGATPISASWQIN